jgi:hypothetical protein
MHEKLEVQQVAGRWSAIKMWVFYKRETGLAACCACSFLRHFLLKKAQKPPIYGLLWQFAR